ncbi:hypothetical protein [Actinoplanes sp. NBRC 101535]|uniref:hypothetical protein n=1 Tax=Actinoplanes sp. NBRC 101535 TaxID=3032196 RepID=UPI0025552F3A|nr:hypothetical protein [Actinoplanes sp. NBRC 101535]
MTRRRHLRDAATICTAVLTVPGTPMRCQLDAGHLDRGEKHRHGPTRWSGPVLEETP